MTVIVTVIVCEFVIVVSLLQDVLVVPRHRLLRFVNYAVVLVVSDQIGLTVIVFPTTKLDVAYVRANTSVHGEASPTWCSPWFPP